MCIIQACLARTEKEMNNLREEKKTTILVGRVQTLCYTLFTIGKFQSFLKCFNAAI